MELMTEDFRRIGLDYNEKNEQKYKDLIRKHTREAAFKELRNKQKEHSKVKSINYESLEKQEYLSSALFSNEEVSILSNLRSHTTRGIRKNFRNMYKDNLNCPLKCWSDGSPPFEDTQEHLLHCSRLIIKTNLTVACRRMQTHAV